MHKKIIMACLAVAAFAAFVVPSASATQLWESTVSSTLKPGASITGKNVGNTLFTAGVLTVTCTSAHMSGTVTKDEGGTIAGEIPAGNPVFTGTHSSGDCTSELGNVKPSVQSKLCLHIAANTDTGTVTGCGANITFTLTVTNVVTCRYTAASLSATITTDPKDAEVNLSEAPASEEGGLFLCPDSGKLDMEFVLTTTSGGTLIFVPDL